MKCNTCRHYETYKMITGREAWGYSGDLPCLRCKHYGNNDEYIPNGISKVEYEEENETNNS